MNGTGRAYETYVQRHTNVNSIRIIYRIHMQAAHMIIIIYDMIGTIIIRLGTALVEVRALSAWPWDVWV